MNEQINLLEHEHIEDLQCDGLKIIQSKHEYRFTTDAVLLANYVTDLTGKTCVEFCAGSGVISLLVAKKKHPARVFAVEIQPQLADMAQRSVLLNNMQNVVTVVCGDVKSLPDVVPHCVDAVVCNPPYRRIGSGERQVADNLAICRHEIAIDLHAIVVSASKILNNKGSFFLVHQSSRLAEIVSEMHNNGITVKDILPVCPTPDKQPTLVLVRGVKCGGNDCVLHSPLYVADADGNYFPQAKAWYGIEK